MATGRNAAGNQRSPSGPMENCCSSVPPGSSLGSPTCTLSSPSALSVHCPPLSPEYWSSAAMRQ